MLLVFIVFMVLLFMGVPVGFAILIGGAMFFFQDPYSLYTTIVQLPITQVQNVNLLAVPLFILAGNLMNASGISSRLMDLSIALTGHMRGGLAQVSVILSTLMGGVSGSANADVAMQSKILGPHMLKYGYPKGYTASHISFTAMITATIPPGVSMIMFGMVGNVSIGRLFAAGLTVGLFMTVLYMIVTHISALVYKFEPYKKERTPFREVLKLLKVSIWAILFPILLLVGIRLGLFTPSEVGAFACVYAIIIGALVYRELTLTRLLETLKQSVSDIGAIMFMISMSAVFGHGIPLERLPQRATAMFSAMTDNPYVMMLIIIAFLLIIGMFIEGAIVIILTTPILLPLAVSYGFDPVVFGLILCTLSTVSNMTPPMGIAMFTACNTLQCPLEDYVKACWPFLMVVIVGAIVYMFFPGLVLFLPNLIFG